MDQLSAQVSAQPAVDRTDEREDEETPYTIATPMKLTSPAVFASPHSGRRYPAEFLKTSRLDAVGIRKSEDSFIDEIFAGAPRHGAPLLMAEFPRAYVDPNREPFELDPDMFDDPLPDYVNSSSPRVAAGLGTVARVVTNGEEIYDKPIGVDDAFRRIDGCYHPYHRALRGLIEQAVDAFGVCLLVDCHSMPSIGGPMEVDPGRRRVDMVLGDNHGLSCNPAITDLADDTLKEMGYAVNRNNPYSGGFTTRNYGRPATGVHALQIEINRATYMNEATIERDAGFEALAADMARLAEILTRIDPASLIPR